MNNYGFEITFNNEKLCRAGLNADFGVISCILMAIRREEDSKEETYIHVGGLDSVSNENANWEKRVLSEGDEIRIKIISGEFDLPESIRKEDPADIILEQKIKYFYKLKEELKEHLKK